ncbi:MAG: DUF368 domain-containing protein [Saprospiraceae bacterium]|nr:DUF368 domain-containing protein [Saprospiraceae bacterium]
MPRKGIVLALKGLAMGMAEVVPGVSGGTIAFITGIYETLINTIKSVVRLPFKTLISQGLGAFWKDINGTWLLTLLAGMVLGVLVGVIGIDHLLEHYPPLVWSFFFGLIISSSIFIARKVKHWNITIIALLVVGAFIAYGITTVTPASASTNLLFIFMAGAVAISALILPGISGSFILLLLGMYTYILGSVKAILTELDFSNLVPILVFALGCFTGLAAFSNLLSWTFKRYRNETLAVLTGFMIGSLNRIWPWRNPSLWLEEESGTQVSQLPLNASADEFKVLVEDNVWHTHYEGQALLWASLLAFFLGLIVVFLLAKFEPSEERSPS